MSSVDVRHPFARLGLRAGAVLRGRCGPEDLTVADGHELIETIIESVVFTRECRQGQPGWAWYLALAACFPNSPATHHAARRDRQTQEQRVREQFGPDESGPWPALPCAGCQERATTVRWGKARLPLAASETEINMQNPGGQPWCWWCRVGTWLLPYAASCNNRSMLTVTSVSAMLEQRIVAAYTVQAVQAVQQRWSTWEGIEPLQLLRRVLAGCADEELTQVEWMWWRNDNREPEISTERVLTERTLHWWHRTWDQPEYRTGWEGLLAGTNHHEPLLVLSRRCDTSRGKDAVLEAFDNAWGSKDKLLERGPKNRKVARPEAGETAALVQDYLRHCQS